MKTGCYGHHGVGHLWLVDPDTKMMEAFELRHGEWVLIATHANEDEIAVPPFEAVPFSLAALWAD